MVNKNLLGGKTTYPEKWWSVQVSWDDYHSWMDSRKIPWFQTTNQWTYFGEINLHGDSCVHKVVHPGLCHLRLFSQEITYGAPNQ
jgi:hypothetical protein